MTSNVDSVESIRVIGLDVGKAQLALHDSVSGRTRMIPNTFKALREALGAFADYDLAVCETTGGYERAALDACLATGIPAHRADAARVKAFIASHGGRAKTDPIDAAWLARYGGERGRSLRRWTPPDPRRAAFAGLVRLRQDTIVQRTQTKNRRAAPTCGAEAPFLDAQIAFLDSHIDELDRAIDAALRQTRDLADAEAKLRTIPGIGPVAARTLLACLPELGALSVKQAASLAGLAPHPRESGASVARRRMTRGRGGLKPTLFMAALSAAQRHPKLKLFYKRLVEAGKPKRLALAAVARKLVVFANATLKPAAQTLT